MSKKMFPRPKKFVVLVVLTAVVVGFVGCKSTQKRTQEGRVANPSYKGGAGEVRSVEVEGLAQITKAGEQSAYDRALEHAMRKAVEVVLGTIVRSEVLVESGALIEDNIYSKSLGFVQQYEVLRVERSDIQKTLTLQVKAWVSLKSVRDDALALGILQSRLQRPYLMVVVDDKSANSDRKNTYNAYLTSLFQDFFTEKEFQFLDEQTYKNLLKKDEQLVEKSREILSDLAGSEGVQVVVLAQVQNEQQQVSVLPPNWVSIRSSVEASAIYTGDASVIATSTASGASSSLSKDNATKEALKKAMGTLNSDLFNKLLKRWDAMINQGFEYGITVGNLSFGEASTLKEALSTNIEGIKNVLERGYKQQTLTLLVRYTGPASELVKMLAISGKTVVPLSVQEYNHKAIKLAKSQ